MAKATYTWFCESLNPESAAEYEHDCADVDIDATDYYATAREARAMCLSVQEGTEHVIARLGLMREEQGERAWFYMPANCEVEGLKLYTRYANGSLAFPVPSRYLLELEAVRKSLSFSER